MLTIPGGLELLAHDCLCHGSQDLSAVLSFQAYKSVEDCSHSVCQLGDPSSGILVGSHGSHGLTVHFVHDSWPVESVLKFPDYVVIGSILIRTVRD